LEPQISNTNNFLHSVFFTSLTTGYIAGDKIILKTTDKGLNWTKLYQDSSTVFGTIYFPTSQTGWAAGSYGKIISTTNAGANWTTQQSGTDDHFVSSCFISPQAGWLSGFFGRILKTTNSGVNWTSQSIVTVLSINKILFTTLSEGWALNFEPYKTTNGGMNWIYTPISNSIGMFDMYFVDSNTGYFCGFHGAIRKTTDAGTTWILDQANTPDNLKAVWFVSRDTGWVVGDQGNIFKTTTGGTPVGIVNNTSVIPNGFQLYQNYPNPFNPQTNISYFIPKSNFVKLKVFDILGKEVKVLINEFQQSGSYSVSFDGTNLSSGIYFYSLYVDEKNIDTKRMVLLK